MKRTVRSLPAVVRHPPYVPPGHFYSPITATEDIERALTWSGCPGVDLREEEQVLLASEMSSRLLEPAPGPRYRAANSMYGEADAAVYRFMLDRYRPARLVEVGSGYSTALALDEAETNPNLSTMNLTCIEPFPDRLLGLLRAGDQDRLTVVRQPVQQVDMAVYDRLGRNDILFIDSTHVAKAGSDVLWLFLHVLPRLAAGVLVHVHDVFWPFEYPEAWLREGRDWTEIYFLHAFLVGNTDWRMVLFSSWLWRCRPDLVPGGALRDDPGSLWLVRAA
jgi:hypothetical protein